MNPSSDTIGKEAEMLTLTAQDRCDRCGARAAHVAKKPGRSDLMFCKHHYREHKDALLENYWLVFSDESPSDPVPASAY